MNITKKIENRINRLEPGIPFKYDQLGIEREEIGAAAKAIERFLNKGFIKRISRGVFYKPKESVFGKLGPSEEELIKSYLYRKGKRIGYITGTYLYNRMGLTTQFPKNIRCASRVKRISIKIGNTQIKPVKSYANVTNENIVLLELLDAFKDFKNIPDLNVPSSLAILKNKLNQLSDTDLSTLIRYALKYPPRTQALLGAVLESMGMKKYTVKLKDNLNPLSTYKLGINEDILPEVVNWNIK